MDRVKKIINNPRPWYLLVLVVVSGFVCIFALRDNNLHMIALRDKVYSADKTNGDVEGALQNLRQYVYRHMNTDLTSGANAVHPPIQLKYTYDRLVNSRDKKSESQNSQIYTDAQSYCQATIPNGFSGRYRLDCIKKYVDSHGVKVQTIPKNLYEFDFVSPSWSPDLAGWSLVVTLLLFVTFVIVWLADWTKKRRRTIRV